MLSTYPRHRPSSHLKPETISYSLARFNRNLIHLIFQGGGVRMILRCPRGCRDVGQGRQRQLLWLPSCFQPGQLCMDIGMKFQQFDQAQVPWNSTKLSPAGGHRLQGGASPHPEQSRKTRVEAPVLCWVPASSQKPFPACQKHLSAAWVEVIIQILTYLTRLSPSWP